VSRKERLRRATAGGAESAPRRSRLEEAALGHENGSGAVPYVALKYYQPEFQCFSEWAADELRAFSDFNRKLRHLTWQLVYQSGGRSGTKTGLGYTPYDSGVLPPPPFLATISEDISWFELRVTQRARVHGFRAGAAFFLVYLDRAHEVFADG
jgi:hypothetical protein